VRPDGRATPTAESGFTLAQSTPKQCPFSQKRPTNVCFWQILLKKSSS
jgi:hypothetical protein